jgi:transcriptional regulator with XRE-family HTH domain
VVTKKAEGFAERFEKLVHEFRSRYALSKASGVPESTLQQYSQPQSNLPPRADILFKLARAANVSVEWLATGKGEMRPAGLWPGSAFADLVMVELRNPRAALQMEEIIGHLPFSRSWLETRLGLTACDRLMLLEADEELPPLIRQGDLLLIDRTDEGKPPRRDGIFVLSVARGLAVRQVHSRLDGRFLVSGEGPSEEVLAANLGRRVVGEVIWRGGRLAQRGS